MNKTIIGLIISLLFLGAGGGLVGGFYTLKAKAESTKEDIVEVKEDVEKVKEDVEENEDDIVENDKIDIEQTVRLEQMQITQHTITEAINNLNRKLEKELAE